MSEQLELDYNPPESVAETVQRSMDEAEMRYLANVDVDTLAPGATRERAEYVQEMLKNG